MVYFMALALALGFGVPVAVLSAAAGQGRAAAAGLESMARQPEQTGRIQIAMILSFAFIESLVIFTLLVFFLLLGKMPTMDQVVQVASAQSGAPVRTGASQ